MQLPDRLAASAAIVMPGVQVIITAESPFPQALGTVRVTVIHQPGVRPGMINALHKQGSARAYLTDERDCCQFSNAVRVFCFRYPAIRLGKKWRATHVCSSSHSLYAAHHIHRIMANYAAQTAVTVMPTAF